VNQSLAQIISVVIGGLLAVMGGLATTYYLEKQRRAVESRNLALAFGGEITALIEHIDERNYLHRLEEIIEQVETTRQPFYMPIRVRYHYDRVYDQNVARIGVLKGSLPQKIPLFYTRLTSVLEDFSSLGDGSYAGLDLEILLRIYRDLHRVIGLEIILGKEILQEIEHQYKP
jgi:hypothetical protein